MILAVKYYLYYKKNTNFLTESIDAINQIDSVNLV